MPRTETNAELRDNSSGLATRTYSAPARVNEQETAEFEEIALLPLPSIRVGVLTGGFDRPYAFGLTMALVSKGVYLDVVGSDELDSPEMHAKNSLRFLNLYGNSGQRAGFFGRAARIARVYVSLISYAAVCAPKILHILWNNKIQLLDRTLLMLYYKILGKRLVLTAHNVNAGKRDSTDSRLNRLSLKIQYRLADHIFVHTDKMKRELTGGFGVRTEAVSVIPFGVNNSIPETDLSPIEARRRLGLKDDERTILFFGAIRPYKGLEYLVEAFQQIDSKDSKYRLIIAAEPKKGSERYLDQIRQALSRCDRDKIIQRLEYIPDEQTEMYFKAADVLVLPYTEIFQSGVLFLAYNFGVPVIAANVGSLAEDIVVGKTGFICKPRDPADLAKTIKKYFASALYRELGKRRREIANYARAKYSWNVVAERTRDVYVSLLTK